MNSEEPRKSGQVRLHSYRNYGLPGAYHHSSGGDIDFVPVFVTLIMAFMMLALAMMFSSPDRPIESASPQPVVLARKPTLAGKYLVVIQKDREQRPTAVIFTYERLRIRVVGSLSQIPFEIREYAGSYAAASTSPKPYIFYGDVAIEVETLTSHDQMISSLLTRHGELTNTYIEVVDGAPRGPPDRKTLKKGGVRDIYVVGTIRAFKGPIQKDRSLLRASIVDLGPSDDQLDTYVSECLLWMDTIRPLAEKFNLPEEKLWSAEAESGLKITPPPPAPYDPFAGTPAQLGSTSDHDHEVEHPEIEHPVF
jgi:hypothetical protein